MHIILILLVVWFVWSFIAALIRENRRSNMLLTILHNKKQLDSFAESLTVSLGEAVDRYDRIDILNSRIPEYCSLCTGKPVQYYEKLVERNPKKIEKIERAFYNDPRGLINTLSEIDKLFPPHQIK
jgi:hypothetical protein